MKNRLLFVSYDIIPAESLSQNAVNFNVSTWTLVPYLTGRTGFSTDMQCFRSEVDVAMMQYARVRCVFQASQSDSPVIQIASLSYDSNGAQVWDYTWGQFIKRAPYNPDNQSIDVSAKLLALLTSTNTDPQLTIRVNGTGVVHEARLEIGYLIPDFTDDIAAINAKLGL